MDLKDFDPKPSQEGVWMTLRHPGTKVKLDCEILLASKDSTYWRDALSKQISAAAEAGEKNFNRETTDERSSEILAACTLGWKGILKDGKELEYSKEAAKDLYLNYRWIYDQVDAFIGTRANFFPQSSKT